MTFLEVLDRRGRLLARHRVDQWPVTVGRAYTSDVIVDDPYVCPAHVRLSRNGDAGLVVEDLGSVNGTRVSQTGIGTASGNVALAVPGINARFDDIVVTAQ